MYYYGDELTPLPQDVEIDAAGGFDEPDVATPIDDNTAMGVKRDVTSGEARKTKGEIDDTQPVGDYTNDIGHKASKGSWESKAKNDQGGRNLADVDEQLECPRCQAAFVVNRFQDLLKHVENCTD